MCTFVVVKVGTKCAHCDQDRHGGSYCRDCFAAYKRAKRYRVMLRCRYCDQYHPNPKPLDELALSFLPLIRNKVASPA